MRHSLFTLGPKNSPLTELLKKTDETKGTEVIYNWVNEELKPAWWPPGFIIKIPRGEEIEDDSRESETC